VRGFDDEDDDDGDVHMQEHLFIVTELLKDNLYEFQRYLREAGLEPYFTLGRLQSIMRQCLEALAFIHKQNLIHCDIKPENIVIKSYSRCEVKIIDFGSSCFTSDHLTSYIQSRSYRAPEVVLGVLYDPKIDVWSLGCVLAELFTGKEIDFPVTFTWDTHHSSRVFLPLLFLQLPPQATFYSRMTRFKQCSLA